MLLRIDPCGQVVALYSEAIDLAVLGQVEIRRASHVEPDAQGQWLVDLAPIGGPVLGPFPWRSDALEVEAYWLEKNWLDACGKIPEG